MQKIDTSFTTVVNDYHIVQSVQYKQLVDYLKEINNIFVSIACEKSGNQREPKRLNIKDRPCEKSP
jgi:hypothetical protein